MAIVNLTDEFPLAETSLSLVCSLVNAYSLSEWLLSLMCIRRETNRSKDSSLPPLLTEPLFGEVALHFL